MRRLLSIGLGLWIAGSALGAKSKARGPSSVAPLMGAKSAPVPVQSAPIIPGTQPPTVPVTDESEIPRVDEVGKYTQMGMPRRHKRMAKRDIARKKKKHKKHRRKVEAEDDIDLLMP